MWFFWFYRFCCIHHRPGKFIFEARKVPKRYSFGGGRVRYFLLCKIPTSWCREANMRGKNCRGTTFCRSIEAQLPSPRGQFWKKTKRPLLWGERQFGRHLRDNLGGGNCESKLAARQWGDNFCLEASRCLAGPSGLTFPRLFLPRKRQD